MDFHFEWYACPYYRARIIFTDQVLIGRHEHLYHRIDDNIVRSDQFPDDIVTTSRLLNGARVILCTMSMLSNPRLVTAGFTRLVPVDTVIIDEASQIEVGDYLPMLNQFAKTIRKIVFIGDDKQRKSRAWVTSSATDLSLVKFLRSAKTTSRSSKASSK